MFPNAVACAFQSKFGGAWYAPHRSRDSVTDATATADADRKWLVTNPGGEQYLIGSEQVRARYVHLGVDRYQAKGAVRAFPNPTGRDVTVIAPWGTEQNGGPDAMLAVAVDAYAPHVIASDRYLIGGQEFADTYVKA